MPPALIHALTWIFLGLLWLFFLRAIRAVWVEVRQQRRSFEEAAEEVKKASGSNLSPLKLRIVEPQDIAGTSYELKEETTIGRSPGCGVPIEFDDFASGIHARIFVRDNKLWIEDLESTNGTFLNEREVLRPVQLKRGDIVQAGNTLFEVYR